MEVNRRINAGRRATDPTLAIARAAVEEQRAQIAAKLAELRARLETLTDPELIGYAEKAIAVWEREERNLPK